MSPYTTTSEERRFQSPSKYSNGSTPFLQQHAPAFSPPRFNSREQSLQSRGPLNGTDHSEFQPLSSPESQRTSNNNMNRWSQSTSSSRETTYGQQHSRRMSLGGSGSFTFGSPDPEKASPRRLSKSRPSTGYASPLSAENTSPSQPSTSSLLPPILTLPSLQTSMNTSSPLTASPSTGGLLSAAVKSAVPDYFSQWDTAPRDFSNPQRKSPSTSSLAPSPIGGSNSATVKRKTSEEGSDGIKFRGHSRNRSEKGSGSSRHAKHPSQKAMLSKALQKANSAVLLDNAQNFEGAMQAYSEACALLQQVMLRSSGDDDRRKLEAIRSTYTSRISELEKIAPHLREDDKALPTRPDSESYRADRVQSLEIEEEHATIEVATATRIVTEQSKGPETSIRSITTPQPSLRKESPLSSASDNTYRSQSRQEQHLGAQTSRSPIKERVVEANLVPPMESQYMPPPLSPRPPIAPTGHTASGSNGSNALSINESPGRGHNRAASNESMSWLDTIDESGGSAASSVHSRTSSMGVRRKHIRAPSGATEAEFDAALDAAVEAAYDDGFEPVEAEPPNLTNYDDDNDDEIVANVRRRVELAKERVRQSEREAAIHNARERERKRRLLEQKEARRESFDDEYDANESEEEERMLEEMTRGFVMDDFEFGLQSKSALPRESDSSGFSGRTWNSSIGSNPTTAGTTLSTVTEAAAMHSISRSQSKAANPPPVQALPPRPNTGNQSNLQGVRSRRLSGQNSKALKIETTKSPVGPLTLPPSMPPPKIPDNSDPNQSRSTTSTRQHLPMPSLSNRPIIPQPMRQASSPFPAHSPSEILSPPTPTLTRTLTDDSESNGQMPRSGSPGRTQSRTGLRKNFSSSSLKTMQSRNLSVSIDDGTELSPNTPMSAHSNGNSRLPAIPALPTPIVAAYKERLNGAVGDNMYLFNSDIHSQDTPGAPNLLSPDAPIPLEACPVESLLRPFWLMRALYQTIAHPKGGYLSTKLFVPRDVWRVKGVKIKNIEDKIGNCDLLTAALLKLARVDTFDADAVLEEMQSLEGVLEQVQAALTKKLGNEVGVQGSGGMFKDAPNSADADSANPGKNGVSASKSSSFSWRRLRSKNSGMALSSAYLNKSSTPDGSKEGLTMATLPMTTMATSKTRFTKRDVSQVQFPGPNASYMGALARLFDAAQALDQIARQVEDPGLRHADKTQVGLELCTRHAAEFFGFYICRFVLTDLGILLDKFIKRGSEWVMA